MTFPTTPVLDNFNRVDQGPPPSSSWSAFDVSWGFGDQLKVVSNQCAGNTFDLCANWWNVGTFGPDSEVYITISVLPIDISDVNLRLRLVGQAGALASSTHYLAHIVRNDVGGDSVVIFRKNGGATTQLGLVTTINLVVGDSFGFERVGNTLTVYQKPAAGSWSVVVSAVDGSPLSQVAGNISVDVTDNTSRLDNFGGGTVAVPSDDSGGGEGGGNPGGDPDPPLTPLNSSPLVRDTLINVQGVGGIGLRVSNTAYAFDVKSEADVGVQVEDGGILRAHGVMIGSVALVGSGVINPLYSDRAAWNTSTYPGRHAKDVSDGIHLHHNPTPVGQTGKASVSDGTKWVATDIVTQTELDAHQHILESQIFGD